MEEAAPTGSKRSALRFAGFDRLITFRTDYDEGEARLVNISTSGCAIHQASLPLEVNQKLLVSLVLDSPSNPLHIRSMVIRANDGNYGLQFQHVEENVKRKLIRFFARETREKKGEQPGTSA
jgi:c-di-GMP-binding flagellar brake protein YcgR